MTNVLIIEDDLIEKMRLRAMLIDFGFKNIEAVSSLKHARASIQKSKPNLLVVDIFLQNETALDFLPEISEKDIPTIFVTTSTDDSIYQEIQKKEDRAYGYLIKPFDKKSLFSTIKLLLPKLNTASEAGSYLLVRYQKGYCKIMFRDVAWMEAAGNYTVLITSTGKFAIKQSLRQTIKDFGEDFVRIHKKFGVNVQHVSQFKTDSVEVLETELPLSYICRKEFMEKWLPVSN